MFFPVVMYRWRVGPWRRLSIKELMLSNCGAGEDSWVPWTARKLNLSILKESKLNIHWKDWCWRGCSNFWYFLTTWYEEPTHWTRPWCWERLSAGGERDDRGKGGCMASPTQRTWVWANPVRWWRTGKPGMQQSMGLQRVGHNWVTEHQHIVGMQKYLLTMAELNIDKVINSPWRNWSPLKEEAIWKSHTDAAYHESFSSPSIFPVSTFPKRSLK